MSAQESLTHFLTNSHSSFEEKVRSVFEYQYNHVAVYRDFCSRLGVIQSASNANTDTNSIFSSIPPIPIDVFKRSVILSDEFDSDRCSYFQSSGTSKQERSKHMVISISWYQELAWSWFKTLYPYDFPVYAYVPAYADNPHSSLIAMLDYFVSQSGGAFLPLETSGITLLPQNEPIILFGAAFGLIEAIENHSVDLHKESIIIETGGMKTFRKEINRIELHKILSKSFSLPQNQIHSEYGMAELMSQSYLTHEKKGFISPPWKSVSIRNPKNPLEIFPCGKKGQLAITDLANKYTCSFILTEDEGFCFEDGSFMITGRLKSAELRGCNFLLERD